jgi:DUF2075 family protein
MRIGKGGTKYRSRPWNFAPGEDYTLFVQGAPGAAIAKNPQAENGCPCVVRGFDFDYRWGVWLEDLIWRDEHWKVQFDHVYETALSTSRARARIGSSGWSEMVVERIKLGYRILITRLIPGVYLYVHDPETRAHINERVPRFTDFHLF